MMSTAGCIAVVSNNQNFQIYNTSKNMEYLESKMETLEYDILICWKWLRTNQKRILLL